MCDMEITTNREGTMTALETYLLSRGVYGVSYDGRDIGTVKNNVVASGAIKWSAYDNLGQRLNGSYLTKTDAVAAVANTR